MRSLERISQHSFLPALVRDTSVTLDLGGNRGEFARGIRQRYGWHVVAVEPNPDLARHLRSLGLDVIEAAVTGEDGSVSFTFDAGKELSGSVLGMDIVGSSLNEETTRRVIEVPAVSLASLIRQLKRPVDMVKVDIEGAELDMFLKSDDETLLCVRQFTVEFHDFWYPQLSERTERAKRRLLALGFWMMRGTPNNKDVLFVHPDYKPGLLQRLYIGVWLRHWHGAGRALRLLARRLRWNPFPTAA